MTHPSRFVAAVLFVLALPVLADEQVLFEVQGRDTVLGTIRPAGEREAILGKLTAGTVLKAAVKSTQKSGPVPTLELLLDDAPVGGAPISVKGRGAVLAPYTVAATGTYKVVVAGDGERDGDYQLAVNWTPKTRFTGAGTSAGDTTFAFSTPPYSLVSIAVSAAPGSPFVPYLTELDGPDGVVLPLDGGAKASGLNLLKRGDWTVHFRTDGAEGDYRVAVKVAVPKVAKHKIDIRDSALAGAFGGASNVVGAVVIPGVGGTVGVDGTGGPIDGASVTVPPGSLGKTTSIFVAKAEPFTPPGADHPAGPAVEFGPSGTKFELDNPAQVTIPFDVDAFPGGTGALVVYVKDAQGNIEPVLPTSSYVFGPNTVTFPTSHFSTFQAATTADRGPPSGTYQALRLVGTTTGHLSVDVSAHTGRVFLQGGFVQGDLHGGTVSFVNEMTAGATIFSSGSGADIGGTMSQETDSTTLVSPNTGAPYRLRRGLTDDILVTEHELDAQLGVMMLFREVPDMPTLNALAGKWHAFVWEFKGSSSGGGQVALNVSADAGPATISPSGVFQAHVVGNVSRSTIFPSGEWAVDPAASGFVNGTLSFDPDNQLVLKLDTTSEVILYPALGGDLLFGPMQDTNLDLGPAASQVGVLVLVRDTAGLAASSLLGNHVDAGGGVTLSPANGDPPNQLGLQLTAQTGGDVLGPGTAFAHDALACFSGYDPTGEQATQSTSRVTPVAGAKFKVTPDGAFTVPASGLVGAVLPSQGAVFFLQRDATTLAPGLILRLPPPGQ